VRRVVGASSETNSDVNAHPATIDGFEPMMIPAGTTIRSPGFDKHGCRGEPQTRTPPADAHNFVSW